MKIYRIFYFFLFIFIYINCYSQKNKITITIISNIPQLITSNSKYDSGIDIKIHNYSQKNALIGNIPNMNLTSIFIKKVNGNYISFIDTDCVVIADYRMPLEGWKDVSFKMGKELIINEIFPPYCSRIQNGDYKIKYQFTYLVGKKRYTIETPWYAYTVDIPENRGKH